MQRASPTRRLSVLLGLAAVPALALAAGELHGTVTTRGGMRVAGPIHWGDNGHFWGDVFEAFQPAPPEPETPGGFQFRLFGWKIGGETKHVSALTVSFGDLRALETLETGQTRIMLKSGEIRDLPVANVHVLLVDDPQRGRVEVKWASLLRVEFSAGRGDGRDAKRLYATVETLSGEHTGYLVWDHDEALADDPLDGEDREGREHHVPLGQVRSARRVDGSWTELELRDGSRPVLGRTNDVDDSNRGLLLVVPGVGRLDIPWSRVRRVRFTDPPPSPSYASFDGGRPLEGTLRLRGGAELRGRITWDRDETHTWEAITGYQDDIEYSVRLGNAASIERVDATRSRVRLVGGGELVLSGTNDVDDTNRGVNVRGPDGAARDVAWSEVERLDLRPRP